MMIVQSKSIISPRTKKVSVKTSKVSLENVFYDLMKDIYWAEKHLLKILPKMAKASFNQSLQNVFQDHLMETESQLIRLENCFALYGMKAIGKKCWAVEGLAMDVAEVIKDYNSGQTRDAGLIAAAQKIEHYEISAYGTLITMAEILSLMPCAKLLDLSREEEVESDLKLSDLATEINQLAADTEEDEAD